MAKTLLQEVPNLCLPFVLELWKRLVRHSEDHALQDHRNQRGEDGLDEPAHCRWGLVPDGLSGDVSEHAILAV